MDGPEGQNVNRNGLGGGYYRCKLAIKLDEERDSIRSD